MLGERVQRAGPDSDSDGLASTAAVVGVELEASQVLAKVPHDSLFAFALPVVQPQFVQVILGRRAGDWKQLPAAGYCYCYCLGCYCLLAYYCYSLQGPQLPRATG